MFRIIIALISKLVLFGSLSLSQMGLGSAGQGIDESGGEVMASSETSL